MLSILNNWNEIISTYSAFNDYVSITSLVSHALIYMLLFLLVTIILLIVFRKIILTPRKHWTLKWLSRSYFLIIPLWMIFCGAKYGLIDGLHQQLQSNIPKAFTAADKEFQHFIDSSGIIKELTPNNAIDISVGLMLLQYENYTLNMTKSENNTLQKVGLFLKFGIQTKIISTMVKSYLKDELEKTIGVDKEISTEILKTKLKEFAKNGVLSKIAIIQIDSIFNPLKKTTLIFMFILLLIPIIEISIAKKMMVKKN